MAKIKTTGLDELISSFNHLGRRLDGCCKAALYDGADEIADAIHASAVENNTPPEIINGLYVGKFTHNNGDYQTQIGITGYFTNRNGKQVPRALVAALFESGSSTRKYPKTGFIRKGRNNGKKKALPKMEETFNDRVQKILEEK